MSSNRMAGHNRACRKGKEEDSSVNMPAKLLSVYRHLPHPIMQVSQATLYAGRLNFECKHTASWSHSSECMCYQRPITCAAVAAVVLQVWMYTEVLRLLWMLAGNRGDD